MISRAETFIAVLSLLLITISIPAFASDLTDLIAQGDKYFQADDYVKAVEYYEKAIEIDPSNYMVWLNMGFSLAELEQYDESLKCYEKAKKLGVLFKGITPPKESYRPDYDKAMDLYESKNYKEAIKLLETLRLNDPSNSTLLFNMGGSYLAIGDSKDAEECFKEIAKKDPLYKATYGILGTLNYIAHSPETAIHYYSIRLMIGVDSPQDKKIFEDRVNEMRKLK